MILPFDNIAVFLYSFYGLIALSLLVVNSISLAVSEFKKGSENA